MSRYVLHYYVIHKERRMKKWSMKRIVEAQTRLFNALLVALEAETADEWTDIGGEG